MSKNLKISTTKAYYIKKKNNIFLMILVVFYYVLKYPKVSFALKCFQHLSLTDVAFLPCLCEQFT